MLRVFITGITGYIGSQLARQMIAQGYSVTGSSLGSTDPAHFQCDLRNSDEMRSVITKANPDIIIHTAAISSVTHGQTSDYYETNVVGTENLIEAVNALGGRRRLVFISTAAVYGNQSVNVLFEELPPLPVSHYGMSKFVGERMFANASENHDITIIRPFNIIGVGQSLNFILPKLIQCFSQRQPSVRLGNLDPVRDYIDLQTACEIISHLSTDPQAIGETVNLCAGTGTSVRDLLNILTKLTGHEIEVISAPEFMRRSEVWSLLGSTTKLARIYPHQNKLRPLDAVIREMLNAVIGAESTT